MKSRGKRPRAQRLTVGLACLGLIWLAFGYPITHNWKLARLRKSLVSLSHPTNTSSLRVVQDVGNLTGSGNQIDYFVGEMRTYSGSKMQVRAFYAGQQVWNPIAQHAESPRVVFADDVSPQAQELTWRQDINGWSLFPATHKKSYIVYFFDGGHAPGLDLRGY